MVDHILHPDGGTINNADGDTVSSAIRDAYSHHFNPLHHHFVEPHLRVEDGHVTAIPGHIQSDPGHSLFEVANLLPSDGADSVHSQSFADVMQYSDPLLHHTEYHMPPLRLNV